MDVQGLLCSKCAVAAARAGEGSADAAPTNQTQSSRAGLCLCLREMLFSTGGTDLCHQARVSCPVLCARLCWRMAMRSGFSALLWWVTNGTRNEEMCLILVWTSTDPMVSSFFIFLHHSPFWKAGWWLSGIAHCLRCAVIKQEQHGQSQDGRCPTCSFGTLACGRAVPRWDIQQPTAAAKWPPEIMENLILRIKNCGKIQVHHKTFPKTSL